MKKVLALVLSLALVFTCTLASADNWLSDFVDGVTDALGGDSSDTDDAVDQALDAMWDLLPFGFSDNTALIERASDSVFLLYVLDSATEITDEHIIGNGSGFLLFDNRTIVTNYHVVADAASLVAESDDGEQYVITEMLVGDETLDIAIVRLPREVNARVLPYTTTIPDRGAKVVAIGSGLGTKNTVTKGIVSNSYSNSSNVRFLQHDAAINPGNSGGPLFNDAGKVVGVNKAMRLTNEGEIAQNANMAIQIGQVVDLYNTWNGVSTTALPGAK